MESVGGAKHVTVGGEKDGRKSGEYNERTFKDRNVAVDGTLQLQAGDAKVLAGGGDGNGDLDLYVEGGLRATADQRADFHFKGGRITKVEGMDLLQVEQGLFLSIGGCLEGSADGGIELKSSQKIVLDSDREVCLKGPGGFVKIDGSGVWIVGNVVNINSGGSPSTANLVVCQDPDDAAKAGPPAPAGADGAKTGQKSC